jgi:hypothetical protein
MEATLIFGLEELSRDLAEQYAKGQLTMDEYLTMWEELTYAHVGGNGGKEVTV